MTGSVLEIVAERWYSAPPEMVFRTFVEPALLERWFCPMPEVALRVERCEPRVGGEYRFAFYFPEGHMRLVVGTYEIVDPPRRLAFTWTWEEPDPWAGLVTRVTIDFVAANGGTQLQLLHHELPSEPIKQVHERGWAGTLDSLGRFISQQRGQSV